MKKTYQLPVTDFVAINLKGSTLEGVDTQKFSDYTEGGDANSASTFEEDEMNLGAKSSLWDN